MLRELFGGAIAIHLPQRFVDVSDLRSVPDNQECFVDVFSDQSVIVELLELNDSITDDQALRYHFLDVAAANGAESPEFHEIASEQPLSATESVPLLPEGSVRFSGLLYGRQSVSKFKEEHRNDLGVFMLLLRMPSIETDLLVSVNAPIAVSPDSSSAHSLHVGSEPTTETSGLSSSTCQSLSTRAQEHAAQARLAANHTTARAQHEPEFKEAAVHAQAVAKAAEQAAEAAANARTAPKATVPEEILSLLSSLAASLNIIDWGLFT